jgi:hypothetical protein
MALFFTHFTEIPPSANSAVVKSFTGTKQYTVDLDKGTCSCPAFKNSKGREACKHMVAVGSQPLRVFDGGPYPTFSQALSGLVKSIRVRRPDEATYWLMYLNGPKFAEPGKRFRVARRILQATGEDGFSLPVMEKCGANFKRLCQVETPLLYYVAEALRCCKIPNWWHTVTNGPDYIHMWLVGWRESLYEHWDQKCATALEKFRQAIKDQDKFGAAKWGTLVGEAKDVRMGMTAQVDFLSKIANESDCQDAKWLCNFHLGLKSPLAVDTNFWGHAVWYLCGGTCPTAHDIEPVLAGECQELIEAAAKRWQHPVSIPGWCCDGIHCAGADSRFAGMMPQMYAVCKAFQHYGRVDPSDQWLPSFLCHDGLQLGT